MSRVFKEVKIEHNPVWALFDTGATYSYVLDKFIPADIKKVPISPRKVILGGQNVTVDELAVLQTELNGNKFLVTAKPLNYLGQDEQGKKIEAIIGAMNMEGALMIIDVNSGEIKFLEQLTEF